MQRAARKRLISAFRENGKSYEKTARSFGLGEDGKPIINRGTIWAILNIGEKVTKRMADRMGIVVMPPKRKVNWHRKHSLLARWVRRNAK